MPSKNTPSLKTPQKAAGRPPRDNGKAVAALRRNARQRASQAMGTIEKIQANGIVSANGIAQELNKQRVPSFRGRRWWAKTVIETINRAKEPVG